MDYLDKASTTLIDMSVKKLWTNTYMLIMELMAKILDRLIEDDAYGEHDEDLDS